MDWTTKIEAYLNNQLEVAERLAFEAAMDESPVLQEQVKVKKTALDAIQLLRMDAKRAILMEEVQTIPKETPRIEIWQNLLKVAAVFLLLYIGLSWYATQNYSSAQLVQNPSYFLAPYDPSLAGSSTVNKDFTEGTTAYFKEKNYAQSITSMEQIPLNNALYQNAQLFIAGSHFRLKEYNKSVIVYQKLLNQSIPEKLKVEVEWNQLLAIIGAGESANSKAQLNQIAQDASHPFQDKAIALQKEQASFWQYLSW